MNTKKAIILVLISLIIGASLFWYISMEIVVHKEANIYLKLVQQYQHQQEIK